MYILIVDYIKPLEEVAPHQPAHGEWVAKYVDAGVLLFGGPKKSKLGGALVAKSIDRKKLMEILAEDSFVKAGVAEYRIVDIDCKRTTPELEMLKLA